MAQRDPKNDINLGPNSAGQSGQLQGLDDSADTENESVVELLEEGNAFEASLVDGIENAPPAGKGRVTTQEVGEDDIPEGYLRSYEDRR